ncbi:MAG: alpha,alpha-trehalose-phosphate synthase (UDP-forming) [Leptospirales bacterium]
MKRPAGGVSQVLHALLERLGGVWIAARDSSGPNTLLVPSDRGPGYLLQRIAIPETLQKPFYNGYSNGTLWPAFHGNREYISHGPSDFIQYDRVNQMFAKKVLDTLNTERPGLVWIHDYQLLRVAHWIRRESNPEIPPLAFFCHIPWPTPADFSRLLEWQSLLEGLLSYDIIGFQTPKHLDLFLETVRSLLPEAQVSPNGIIDWNNRQIHASVMPVGIDPPYFRKLAHQADNERYARDFLKKAGIPEQTPFIISVDRMDYTKGLYERISILDSFFTYFPEWRGQISFLQIAVPTRSGQKTYRSYQERLRTRIQELNDKWKVKDWIPLRSVETTLSQSHLAALYKMAQGALITSTNDGMNLVAQEFLACQGSGEGVLFLSRHTGSAHVLKGAVLIDPFKPVFSARQMNTGLLEKKTRKISRNASLNQKIEDTNLYGWMNHLLNAV